MLDIGWPRFEIFFNFSGGAGWCHFGIEQGYDYVLRLIFGAAQVVCNCSFAVALDILDFPILASACNV